MHLLLRPLQDTILIANALMLTVTHLKLAHTFV